MIQADTPYLETFIDTQDVIMSIGITDGEKGPENKQTVRVSVQMYQLQGRFDDGAIETCLDYSRVHDYIENWANRAHTDLVETLAEDLFQFIFEDPRVDACRLRIQKPDIYKDAKSVGVAAFRKRP